MPGVMERHAASSAALLLEQAKIKALTEYLQREQDWLKTTNERLERERDRLQSANKQLLVDQHQIKGGNELEHRDKRLEMASGLLSAIDIEAVTELAKLVPAGGIIVDVGSLIGMTASLWCIHSAASRIVCIDPWELIPSLESFMKANGPTTKETFLANVPDDRIETIQGYSPSCAEGWTTPIDLYWEDGDHSNPTAANSIRFWSSHVKPGGIACGHDYHLPDVKAEADALSTKWASTLHLFGSVWWVRRGP
jgi:hypothetical protein